MPVDILVPDSRPPKIGPCREWPGARTDKGYGRIRWGPRDYILVHRFVWSAAHGEIPLGKMVLHTCDNPPCFVLGHLYLGTHSDNMRDRRLAGHYESRKGQANNAAKLTDADVLELRRLYDEEGWIQQDLADRYGIAQPHVSAIVRRRSWTHLK